MKTLSVLVHRYTPEEMGVSRAENSVKVCDVAATAAAEKVNGFMPEGFRLVVTPRGTTQLGTIVADNLYETIEDEAEAERLALMTLGLYEQAVAIGAEAWRRMRAKRAASVIARGRL